MNYQTYYFLSDVASGFVFFSSRSEFGLDSEILNMAHMISVISFGDIPGMDINP